MQSVMNVTMVEDFESLDEVVVVGYGFDNQFTGRRVYRLTGVGNG